MGPIAMPSVRGEVLPRIATLLAVAMVAGILVAGVALPGLAVAAAADSAWNSLYAELPSSLADPALPQTSVMQAADGSPIAYFYDENRTEVPLRAMSPLIRSAVVAIEDARFTEHGAVDVRGTLRALASDLTGGVTEGGSTLTQQYVKNALLESATGAGDRAAARAATAISPARKLREAKLAVDLEQRLSKDQILERYLNIVYFGGDVYGVEAAAERYFGVHASRLDLAQAATLAGMVRDPVQDDPVTHPAQARRRRDVVLDVMLAQHLVDAKAVAAATARPVVVSGHPLPNGCEPAGGAAFFCDDVVRTIATDPGFAALGASEAERLAAITRGGLVIRTTLDRATQSGAERALQDRVPATDPSGLGAAAVTVEPGTGKVLGMAENRSYSVAAGPGSTSVNYSTDAAVGGSSGFQTGSAFKPFTLATWLSHGHGLGESVDATRRAFPFHDFTSCGQPLAGESYTPGNSEGTETGPMSVLSATANSVNVAYVDMESRLDLCDIAATAEALGVHLAAPEQECSPTGPPSTKLPTCLPSLTLGVKNIAPLTMAAAYAGFADGGTYCSPVVVTSIVRAGRDTTTSGAGPSPSRPVPVPSSHCTQALDPAVASGVTTALRQVLTRGTAAAVGAPGPWPAAGKTGTTDGPRDTWFVGYTAQRSTAVWVGDPGAHGPGGTRRVLTGIRVGGRYYSTVYGASIAAPIWRSLMAASQQGLPVLPLP